MLTKIVTSKAQKDYRGFGRIAIRYVST